jgi:predicted signal transduction protein with EAL and GGDEF domain/DNA-binding response OmpR family regulator
LAPDSDRDAPRLLLGDCDAASRDGIIEAARAAGVRVAGDGTAALDLPQIEELHPELVVLDATAGGKAAYRLCTQVRGSRHATLIPVVVLVDASDADALAAGVECGVTDFVAKPVDVALFTRRLHVWLRASQTMRNLHVSRMRLARVQRIAHLGSWVRDLEAGEVTFDDELRRILGASRRADLDPVSDLVARAHPDDRAHLESTMRSMFPHRVEYRVLIEQPGEPAAIRSLQQEAWLVQDEPGGRVELIGTVLDITQLKEAQSKIARLAYYDVLTGLPNRAFLKEHLQLTLARRRRSGSSVGVLALDLDFFKRVNDSLGHPAGDALLTVVAQRISSTVRNSDSVMWNGPLNDSGPASDSTHAVARIGGDEFIVVLNDLRAPEDAAIVAKRIIDSLAQPVAIGGTQVFTGCSVGIAICPDNGETPDALLKNADTALYHAKDQGRGSFHFFSEALANRARRRMELESGLRAAIAADQLLLHYQPKVNIATRRVTSCEALLRWPTADGRFIPPDQFIPVAEDTGLIIELGKWVLRTACLQAKQWSERLGRELRVAVNVSSRQLSSGGFETTVAEVLAESGLPPELLEIEITEGAIMRDTEACALLLGRIRNRNIRIALDDFGTGYSSLSYLTRLPIDSIKIDRSFIRDLGGESSPSVAITSAILALSRAVSLQVVAEGVETEQQLEYLIQHGCDEAQGYLFARPMAPDAFEAWLETSPR